jgi:hypothetical protein
MAAYSSIQGEPVPAFCSRNIFWILPTAFLAFSCATSPHPIQKSLALAASLPQDAAIYGVADVARAKNIIRSAAPALFADQKAVEFLENSAFAALGIYRSGTFPAASTSRGLFLAVCGHYPASSYQLGLMLSPGWNPESFAGKKWWRKGLDAVSITKEEAFLRRGETPPPPSPEEAAHAVLPEEITDSVPPPVLAFFVSSAETSALIRRLGIPLEMTLDGITMTVSEDTGQDTPSWSTRLRLKTKSASEAKALSAIFSLARITVGRGAEISLAFSPLAWLFFSNPPVVEGSTLIISGTTTSESALGGLFSPFLVSLYGESSGGVSSSAYSP